MRKKWKVLCCILLSMVMFVGCSKTELAYLKMSNDIISTMQPCVTTGSIQVEIDFDALQKFIAGVGEKTGNLYDTSIFAQQGWQGEKSIEIVYDMQMDWEKSACELAIDVLYEANTYDLGTLYYCLQKGVFVTGDTFWGMYELGREIFQQNRSSYVLSDAFAKEFKMLLSENAVIELISAEELRDGGFTGFASAEGGKELYQAAIDFYQNMLNGFETGMVKEIPNGYQITANGKEVAQLLENVLRFIAEHPEQVIQTTQAYCMKVLDLTEVGTPEEKAEQKAVLTELFVQASAAKEDFSAGVMRVAEIVEEVAQEEGIALLLDSFQYTGNVKKTDTGYDSDATYTLVYQQQEVCRLQTDAVLKQAKTSTSFPENSTTIRELLQELAELENKFNPVTQVHISWEGFAEKGYADIQTFRSVAEGLYFNREFVWTELRLKEGRAYLPLETIAAALGEGCEWEKDTPYLLRDGKKVEMKCIQDEGRTFISIREFEKMGYTVVFETAPSGLKTVQMEKA